MLSITNLKKKGGIDDHILMVTQNYLGFQLNLSKLTITGHLQLTLQHRGQNEPWRATEESGST